MIHLGDITKINGYDVPTTDVVVGGSPCQDLSVAGLRKGLQHSELGDGETTRSGLFMEQIRLVKEMRENDRRRLQSRGADEHNRCLRPRYMVWENVPGAFSSNKGNDFRVVLEEVARVVERGVTIPEPPKGKWTKSGCIIGDGYSIAWRVFDAQYWGVPQRRKRICLVADFNGYSAPEIVFNEAEQYGCSITEDCNASVSGIGDERGREVQSVSEGLSGYLEPGKEEGQSASEDAARSIGTSDCISINCQGGSQEQFINGGVGTITYSTNSSGNNKLAVAYTYQDREGKPGGGKGGLIQEELATSLRTNNYMTVFQPVCYGIDQQGGKGMVGYGENVCPTICSESHGTPHGVAYVVDMGGGKSSCDVLDDKSPTLCTTHGGEPAVAYGFDPGATRDVGDLFLEETSKTLANGTFPGHHAGVVIQAYRKTAHPRNAEEGQGYEEASVSDTLNVYDNTETRTPTLVAYKCDGSTGGEKTFAIVGDHENRPTDMTNIVVQSKYIDVEVEVEVRKYPVDVEKLKNVLREHKNMPSKDIADALNKPLTLVEHWFRQDEFFAIPDADIWYELKKLLEIDTDEFDVSITTFESRPGNFDMRNRIYSGNVSPTLSCGCGNNLYLLPEGNRQISTYQDTVGTLCARDYKCVGNQYVNEDKLVVQSACYWDGTQTAGTLTANNADGSQRMPDKENFNCVISATHGNFFMNPVEDVCGTLQATDYKEPPMVTYPELQKTVGSLMASGYAKLGTQEAANGMYLSGKIGSRYIVRRLTPLECERLQGYPDGWTDIGDYEDASGKIRHTVDSHRYKAMGNSIALPSWRWIMKRISAQYDRSATLASLFDGVGGFPLVWEQINGKGTCLWASEIEDFPIAVTKKRFKKDVRSQVD